LFSLLLSHSQTKAQLQLLQLLLKRTLLQLLKRTLLSTLLLQRRPRKQRRPRRQRLPRRKLPITTQLQLPLNTQLQLLLSTLLQPLTDSCRFAAEII
jgi:hypothetical protein